MVNHARFHKGKLEADAFRLKAKGLRLKAEAPSLWEGRAKRGEGEVPTAKVQVSSLSPASGRLS